MSIFEQALNIITKDLTKSASAWSDRIINANLPHAEYTVAQTMYRVLSDVVGHINTAIKHIHTNPDVELPETFLSSTPGTADPEEKEPESTVHTVDIESGTVSHGSN